jgi:meso-butanediol dehydrogenase / (S,S)-butanediol dehydrogenase / diacetyl reductase
VKLQSKVCIVTGGATGIGRAAAIALAREGAAVVVGDVNESEGGDTVETIARAGGQAMFVVCDVAREDDAKRLVDTAVGSFGKLDVLFNNAGINPMEGNVVDMSVEQWRRVLAINLDGIFFCSRHAIPHLRANGGGRIINTASPSSFKGWTGNAAYIASKGAVMSLTRAMALDHARDNIRVNAIVPGLILTPLGNRFLDAQTVERQTIYDGIPVGRAGQPEDVAPLVVFLAADESTFSTGAPFFVDGGELAG